MNLKVGVDGRVLVCQVTENGAAERASDPNGNTCPIKLRDEIIDINGVSLNVIFQKSPFTCTIKKIYITYLNKFSSKNMTNEDISSIVQELPLFISLKLKRRSLQEHDPTDVSPTSAVENNNESSSSGHTSPNIINIKVF